MASEQSGALADLYRKWASRQAAQPNMPIAEMRRMFDHWGDVTTEPGQVDYIETDVEHLQAMWILPKHSTPSKVLLCAHGGGYVAGSIYTHRKMHGHIAKAVGCRALSINYRLAPEFSHPASVKDMVSAFRWLMSHEGVDPQNIALVGDSAGGSLALTTVAALKRSNQPLPGAIVSMSPWAGSDTSGDSYEINAANDVLVTRGMSVAIGQLFLGRDGDPQDPLANPLRINYAGFPPLYIQAGSHEAVLSDSTRPAEAARQAGVDVKIDIFPEMQHCFQLMVGAAPEADDAAARIAVWLRSKLNIDG